ncbi:MAG: hypothetical protein PQJ61_02600 [Spirochaetales bacterium]|uniref:Tetratricopeptide repeat protein n=1 Tax=Candidatus Thalassospirochaeta sargassi TaxID=3119039 RepID=A0AAJ1IG89_9SPIO|nr:hypothetical protein [Spirochaetales bacterium]
MKKLAFLLILTVLAAGAVFSMDFSADYVDGYLDVKEDGSWYEVYIGDMLPPDAVVKLDNDSYAELSYGSEIIKLSRPGVYELGKLVNSKREVASSGSTSLFSGKFRTLLKEDSTKTQSTVGGVRAAEAETVTIDWMSSETADLIADGRAALDAGELDDAYDLFMEAYDFSADEYEESEALYFLGLSSAVQGDYSDALMNLDMVEIDEDSEFYTDFYLLKGQLLVESYAYAEAQGFLEGYDTAAGRLMPAKLQEVYFLMAIAANNNGDTAAARTALSKCVSLDANSETGKAAKGYRGNL